MNRDRRPKKKRSRLPRARVAGQYNQLDRVEEALRGVQRDALPKSALLQEALKSVEEAKSYLASLIDGDLIPTNDTLRPTPKQRMVLRRYGLTAASKADAIRVIGDIAKREGWGKNKS